MANNRQATIQLGIGFQVDKSGLTQLESSLKEFSKLSATEIQKMNPALSMKEAMKVMGQLRQSVTELQGAFGKAFDSKIGVLNIEKLQSSLNKLDLHRIYKDFAALGEKGHAAFLQISQSALTTNIKLKETNSLMNKMGTTLINTLKWTFSSSLINRFTGSIQQAVGYVEHLDKSLNDIRIVTKKSAEEMDRFAEDANKAAKALGKATTDYTEASLIYYQQGLSDEEVKARTDTTLKAASVTGQATSAVAEQLTSVWNGFKVNAEQTEEYVDKLAAVAAMSASNLEELSTGMSKVASAASNLGVDIDQLTAQISTIVSVTRQAPETVGTALKTIYARISDLKLGESDEDGLGLGDVSGGLKNLGIDVLDAKGELRDLGTVIEEVAAKWDTWTSAQQAAVAQLMAGKRQYNNLVSLFSNWDKYEAAIKTSRNATGELQKQQDIYMESTEAQLQQLKTQWEDLYDSLLDADAIKTVANMGDGLLTVLTKIIDTIGGGKTVITGLIGFILNKFSPQITSQIFTPMIKNMINAKTNAAALNQVMENTAKALAQSQAAQQGWGSKAAAEMAEVNSEMHQYWDYMSAEEKNQAMEMTRQIGYWADQEQQIEEAGQAVDVFIQKTASATEKRAMGSPETAGIFAAGSAQQNAALKHLKDYKDKVDDIKNSYTNLDRIYKSVNNNIQKTNSKKVTSSTKKEIEETKTSLQTIKDKINELRRVDLIDPKIAQTAQDRIDAIKQRLDQIKAKPGQAQQILRKEDLDDLNGLMNVIRQLDPELAAYFDTISNGAEKLEGARKATQGFKDSLGKDELALRKKTQNITQFIGGVTQAIFLLQSASGVLDTLFDDSIDAGEKFAGVLSSLVMIIPSVISTLGTLNKLASESNGGFMSFFTMGKVGIILAVAAGIMAVVKGIKALIQAGYQEAAENTKNLAEASKEAADAAREHKSAIDELKTSYEALDQTSITYRDDLRKLLIDHGKFAEAAQVATSSLEELDEMMKKLQEDANNKVIDTSTEQIERLKNAISADINANVLGGTERDFENGVETIDLGSSSDTADIAQILKENGIDVVTDSGHINLQQFVNAMVENEAELRKALQENGSAAARRLLEIMGAEQEMLSTTAEALTAKQEAQLSNIENNVDIKSNGTFEEYDKAFEELKQKANGIFKDDAKAEEWAKKRIAESGAVGTAYAGLSDEVKDIVRGIDKELTVSQLNYLNEHVDLYKAYGSESAEAFLEGAQEVIDGQSQGALMISVAIGLGKDELKDEDISALFANGPLGDLTEDEFKLFDAQKQKRELRKYFSELAAEQETYNKETVANYIKSLEDQQAAQENAYNQIMGIAEKYHIKKESLDAIQNKNFIEGVQQQKDALVKNYQQQQEYINQAEKKLSNNNLVGDERKVLNDNVQKTKQQQQLDIEQIQHLNDRISASKELEGIDLKILETYEATTKEIENQKAAIMANSKELASSIQDIEMLEEAYKSGNITDTDYTERYMQLDRERDIEGLDTSQLEDYTKYLQEIATSSDDLADSLQEDGDAADKVAKSIMKMNKGVEELSSNFENWDDILRHSNKDSQEYLTALSGMRKAVSQLLDIAEDYVSSNFLNENLELIGKAAEGDAEAIDSLRAALAKDVVMNLKLNDEGFRDDLLASVTSWQAELDGRNLEVGATLDDTSMIDAMNEMIQTAGLTVDQVNALFDSMGFEANFATEPQKVHQSVPEYVTETVDYGTTTAMYGDQPVTLLKTRTHTYQDGFYEADGVMDAMAMTTNGKPPKINSITKKAGGSFNNASGSNAGGAKKSGGGGGGGGGKSAQPRDPMKRETDIYREVNEELSTIGKQLDSIQTKGDHTWGASQIPILEKEAELLDQQTKALEKKNKLQKGDLSSRRKQLEMEGVEFTEDGSVMKNAEAVIDKLYADYNKKLESMSAEEQEAHKKELDDEQKRIQEVEKKISEYESLYTDYEDVLKQIQDNYYKSIEINVEKFTHDINIKLELKEAKRNWNDFWYDVIKDVDEADFGGRIAKSMAQLKNLIGVGTKNRNTSALGLAITKGMQLNENGIMQLKTNGKQGIFGTDTKKSKEELTAARDEIMSLLKDAQQEMKNLADTYLDTFRSARTEIDKQIEGWESIDKQIEHNIALIQLLDPSNNYDALNKQYEMQYENDLKTIETQRMAKEHYEKEIQTQAALMNQYKKGSIEWKAASDAYNEAVEEYRKSNEDLNASVEKSLEDLQKLVENLNAQSLDKFDKSLSAGLGLDAMEEEWKLINDEANKYYDNVERYLNMEEYTNILNEAANAVGLSAENQQKLNAFRDEELKQLSEKKKLTEYDIAESKARLEIMKAQMALEDAQRNKSNMRLRRDSQGNYNYQYVADESKVDEAENGVLTAKKSWYDLVKKRFQETSQEILNDSKQLAENMAKLSEAIASKDEVRIQHYQKMVEMSQAALAEDYKQAETNKQHLYSGTAQYFANVENAAILPQAKATVRTLVNEWAGGGEESFTGAVNTAIQELEAHQAQFAAQSEIVLTQAGINYAKIKEGIDPTIGSLQELNGTNDQLKEKLDGINESLEKQSRDLGAAGDAYRTFQEQASTAITAINKTIDQLSKKVIKATDDINKAVKAAQKASKIKVDTKSSDTGSGGGGGGGGGGSSPSSSTSKTTTPSTPAKNYKLTAYDDKGFILTGYPKYYSDKAALKAVARPLMYKYSIALNDGTYNRTISKGELDSVKQYKLNGFKSGGYTGKWGNEGKLAVLHEKELVLNASDTQNILSAVELLRALPFTALAQSIVDSSSNIAASFRSGANNMSGIDGQTTNNETKSMVVNADFSGVRSADEIYQALLELENYGLQNSYSVAPHANSSY